MAVRHRCLPPQLISQTGPKQTEISSKGTRWWAGWIVQRFKIKKPKYFTPWQAFRSRSTTHFMFALSPPTPQSYSKREAKAVCLNSAQLDWVKSPVAGDFTAPAAAPATLLRANRPPRRQPTGGQGQTHGGLGSSRCQSTHHYIGAHCRFLGPAATTCWVRVVSVEVFPVTLCVGGSLFYLYQSLSCEPVCVCTCVCVSFQMTERFHIYIYMKFLLTCFES